MFRQKQKQENNWQQNNALKDKQENGNTLTNILLPLGAVALTVCGMFIISFSVIVCTGIFFGGNQAYEAQLNTQKKNSGMVIVLSSKSVEDEIRKSRLDTPELPSHFRTEKPISLLNSQLSYRY